jgi:hypothetical protein
MTSRNFTVTVQERNRDEPCFLVFETNDNIGLGTKAVRLSDTGQVCRKLKS